MNSNMPLEFLELGTRKNCIAVPNSDMLTAAIVLQLVLVGIVSDVPILKEKCPFFKTILCLAHSFKPITRGSLKKS